jgi:hypothetical protein
MSKVFIGKEYTYHCQLLQLIQRAREDGIVLTIDLETRYPLATGNFDMTPGARYSRTAKATKLWMLNIEGPDDIVAAPSFMDAIKVRDDFNAYWAAIKAAHSSPEHFPTLRAVIHEWDGTPEEHAANVAEYWLEYIGFDEALKSMKERK